MTKAGRTNMNVDATAAILDKTYHTALDDLPGDVLAIAKQIWMDWIAVSIAGGSERVVDILVGEAIDQNGSGECALTGRPERLGLSDAVMTNAAASHVLDYDDGNPQMMGHSSVVILPVLYSLGELGRHSGREIIEAVVTAHETGMRIGNLVDAKAHYERGFHATATLGGFAAAAGAARLLGLDSATAAVAMGIAGAYSIGFKSVFGTMGKSYNASRTALNGLLGARLAKRGFTAPSDLLGARQGFCDALGTSLLLDRAIADPAKRFHIYNNWFKYHAACQTTHATIEAARALRAREGLDPAQIQAVTIHAPIFADRVCNIAEPKDGLELKFSIRATAAMALLGLETADPRIYTEALARDPAFVALRDKVFVDLSETQEYGLGLVDVTLRDGRTVSGSYDNETNRPGVEEQRRRLTAKFRSLVTPRLGSVKAAELERMILDLENVEDFSVLARLCASDPTGLAMTAAGSIAAEGAVRLTRTCL